MMTSMTRPTRIRSIRLTRKARFLSAVGLGSGIGLVSGIAVGAVAVTVLVGFDMGVEERCGSGVGVGELTA